MYKKSIKMVEGLGGRVAQAKYDGWRCMIIRDTTDTYLPGMKKRGKDGSLRFVSRRDLDAGGPTNLPVSDEVVEFVESLDLPDQTVLDSEWMARRTIGECPERLYVFDLLWWDNEWQGKKTYSDRLAVLSGVLKPEDEAGEVPVMLPLQVAENFGDFFNRLTELPYTEGMVIKPLNSTLKGNRTGCSKNPLLVKIKWRDGANGRDVFHGKV
jgi:ATP-dependent DNA ligase